MIVDVAMRGHNLGQQPFIDVARREISIAEVRLLVGVVKLEVVRLSELVIYASAIR